MVSSDAYTVSCDSVMPAAAARECRGQDWASTSVRSDPVCNGKLSPLHSANSGTPASRWYKIEPVDAPIEPQRRVKLRETCPDRLGHRSAFWVGGIFRSHFVFRDFERSQRVPT